MSDENPFDDLGGLETEETDPADEHSEPAVEAASQPSSDSPSADRVQSDVSKREDTGTDAAEDTDTETDANADLSGPSFEYAEVQQRPLYVRERTWDEFEDAVGISVVPELRREGVRDEAKREIHDAVISLAVEEPERLVELILERRRD
ncbi:hypothetical protein [Natronosalvus rutilus]|uniref:Uncharacterized protein n=1 Tax=Natronosalvus rutilus TaxID=2953753 RepID=A0A9E7N655_9EURY|nr:hypothetical protein [Natronosalvus rutilus]UTF52439.1 hypothetical protein NGM29_11630 [Natronosalvus rutilus]